MRRIFIVFIIVNIVSPTTPSQCAPPVQCSGGSFVEGSTAYINCYFNKNVNATMHNFNVVHYSYSDDGTTSYSGNRVLLCNWDHRKNQVECKMDNNYVFNHVVADTLRLEIPHASKAAAGMYVCQLVPDDGIPVHTCHLTVQDAPPKKVLMSTESTTDPQTPGLLEADECDECKGMLVGLILVLVVLIIVIALLVTLVILRLKQNKLSTVIDNCITCIKPSCTGSSSSQSPYDAQAILCRCCCISIPSCTRYEVSISVGSPAHGARKILNGFLPQNKYKEGFESQNENESFIADAANTEEGEI